MKRQGKNNNYILLFFMFLLFCLMVLFMANSKTIQESFENMMASPSAGEKPFTLEYYYTESCPYCISFNESKVWDKLSSQPMQKVAFKKYMVYDKEHKPVKENVSRADALGISSYPTFVVVKTGTSQSVSKYDGDRSFEDMMTFVKKYE